MKKIIKLTLAVVVLVASAATGYLSYTQYQEKQLAYANPLMMENINALAESGSSNYHICYSESKVRKGYTYYDCGDCTTKVYDEQGKGTYSKCFY